MQRREFIAAVGTAAALACESVEDLHGTIATIILILAGLHASAGLLHHYLWHDVVLRRILAGAN